MFSYRKKEIKTLGKILGTDSSLSFNIKKVNADFNCRQSIHN